MSTSSGGASLDVSGGGAMFGIAGGGVVAPNLILYGAFMFNSAVNPDVKFDGTLVGTGTGDSSADIVAIGPGVAYYIEPANVFLSGTLLLAKLTVNDSNGNKTGESDWGFGIEGQVGKEWWVSDHWGLGAAAQILVSAMKDKEALVAGGEIPTWTATSFSLAFSATYN
jgi:hypothetical protein